eukprot:scaffold86919_cov22-Prasinocladus_malaysianus.AAC.2
MGLGTKRRELGGKAIAPTQIAFVISLSSSNNMLHLTLSLARARATMQGPDDIIVACLEAKK